jgi:ABC-type sugar transport system permease subunit
MNQFGRLLKLVFLCVPLAYLASQFALPLVSGIVMSFAAGGFSLANYGFVLHDPLFWRAWANNLILPALSLCLEFVLGLLFALLLSSARRVSIVTEISILLPFLIPEIVFLSIARYILLPRGYLNGALFSAGFGGAGWLNPGSGLALASVIVVDAWHVTPVVTLVLLGGLQTIPAELYEAAHLDGAGAVARLRHVTLPFLKPALFAALLLRGVDALRIFSTVLVLTGAEGTPVLSTYAYQLWSDALEPRVAMAASVMLALLITLLSLAVLVLRRRAGARGEGSWEYLAA